MSGTNPVSTSLTTAFSITNLKTGQNAMCFLPWFEETNLVLACTALI